jgi:cell division protein FtsW
VNKRSLDVVMLWAVLCLITLGVVMVYSASSVNAAAKLGDADYYLKRQAVFAGIGIIALVVGSAIPVEVWRRVAVPLLGIALFSLLLVKIPGLGRSAGGAARWLQLGPISVQPSEAAKFAVINFLAYSLFKKRDVIHDFRLGFANHGLVTLGTCVLLLLQKDFGTSAVLVVVTSLLLIGAGVRLRYLVGGLGLVVPMAALAVVTSKYRMDRVAAFMDPWAHRQDIAYQVTEGLISFGSGGITGLGLGAGKQKLFFLPAAHTDFIFAIIGEELGLLGVLFTISLFGLIGWRGLLAFRRLGPTTEGYLAAGLTMLFLVQASVNMSVVLGLVPNKGLTLPFVSYGGSSLIAFCLMAGVLLRLCSEAGENVPVLRQRPVTGGGWASMGAA